jgi:hypothetical protein
VKLTDLIPKEQKTQLEAPKKEVLSKKDIEELMGIRRDIYVRSKGAIRRK